MHHGASEALHKANRRTIIAVGHPNDQAGDRIMSNISRSLCSIIVFLTAAASASAAKPRIVVMTDIGGDPDDRQSMVRFLLYACDFQVEGLCTGFGHGHYKQTRPDLIRQAVEAYGKVLPNLRKHRKDYPSAKLLGALIKDGSNGDPHSVGKGRDSEASNWIIKVLDRDDPRPVWFSIWGGPRELAQAIWKVSQTRSPAQLAAFKKKIRVHSIADQDRTAGWVKKNHPEVFWLYSNRMFRGIWQAGDQEIVSPKWLERNVRTSHGPLGAIYPANAAGKKGVKEGDTPSFLYVLDNGLSDPEKPGWGNWGGRFRPAGRGNEYLPAGDVLNRRSDILYSIHRWRRAYQNEFEARMDWCVKPQNQANHAPTAVCNSQEGTGIIEIAADPSDEVKLTARGSSDPDGDKLAFGWRIYPEAGSYWGSPKITGASTDAASITVPSDASGRTIHVILEVTDSGKPSLTAYRRAVLKISGELVKPPAGAPGAPTDLRKPVTRLTGPPSTTGKWEFYRGVNINGPAIAIDGNKWDGDNAANFTCTNRSVDDRNAPVSPPTNTEREKMIRSFRWDRKARIVVSGVPDGKYAVYVYVWEETSPETFTISLSGRDVARDYDSGPRGCWRRLGPWAASPVKGKLEITSRGGAANFSGLEVWKASKGKQAP